MAFKNHKHYYDIWLKQILWYPSRCEIFCGRQNYCSGFCKYDLNQTWRLNEVQNEIKVQAHMINENIVVTFFFWHNTFWCTVMSAVNTPQNMAVYSSLPCIPAYGRLVCAPRLPIYSWYLHSSRSCCYLPVGKSSAYNVTQPMWQSGIITTGTNSDLSWQSEQSCVSSNQFQITAWTVIPKDQNGETNRI